MTMAQRKRRITAEDPERGSITLPLIILVVALILFMGLVVDGSGKVQAAERASQVAQSAARFATNSLTGEAIATGTVQLNRPAAVAAAQGQLAAAGLTGNVTATDNTVTVTTSVTYNTVFLGLIGIETLSGEGTGSARLIDG
ncbi:MAG: hypothetical protein JWQ43_132 [Glaciihabitans sp.]|nr:hypothetical protein [Glaciihabitans sp.]